MYYLTLLKTYVKRQKGSISKKKILKNHQLFILKGKIRKNPQFFILPE